MAVRQFIGARYLVKFDGEWSQDEAYEAITAVQHEAFTYISKQPVPAGVAITNTDFWLLWADPNAQMEQLRETVESYTGSVTAIEEIIPSSDFDSVNTVKAAIDANSGNISDIASLIPSSDFDSVNTVKAAIDAEASKIDDLYDMIYEDSSAIDFMVNGYVSMLSSYAIVAKIPRSIFKIDGILDYTRNTVQTFLDNKDCIFGAASVVSSYVSNSTTGGSNTHSTGWGWVAQNQDDSLEWVEDYNCSITPAIMQARGFKNAWISFGPIRLNGNDYDVQDIPLTAPEYDYVLNANNARSIFGWDDDYFYIGIIDARTPFSHGCDFATLQSFIHDLDIENCINMDGGGSTELWLGGLGYNAAHIRNPGSSHYDKPNEARDKSLAIIKRK